MSHLFHTPIYKSLIRAAALVAIASAVSAPAFGGESRPVPDCALKRLDTGAPAAWNQWRGKVLYVDFWASWCTSCVRSFPFLNRLDRDLSEQGLQVVGVNVDENPEDAARFLDSHTAAFTILADTTSLCPKAFGVPGMPVSYLIDRQGNIRYTHLGFRAAEAGQLREKVEQLLNEPPGAL